MGGGQIRKKGRDKRRRSLAGEAEGGTNGPEGPTHWSPPPPRTLCRRPRLARTSRSWSFAESIRHLLSARSCSIPGPAFLGMQGRVEMRHCSWNLLPERRNSPSRALSPRDGTTLLPTAFQDRSKENLPTNLVPLCFKPPMPAVGASFPQPLISKTRDPRYGWERHSPTVHPSDGTTPPQSGQLRERSVLTAPSDQGGGSLPQPPSVQDGETFPTVPRAGILRTVPLPRVGDPSHSLLEQS